MLYFVANPTNIYKIRLDTGMKRELESEDFVFVHVRKSKVYVINGFSSSFVNV